MIFSVIKKFKYLLHFSIFIPVSVPLSLYSRLEQNLIKSVPAGAFSAYKKLKRMWVCLERPAYI